MITTALYVFGAIQGAWTLSWWPIIGFMFFDLVALEIAKPEINL